VAAVDMVCAGSRDSGSQLDTRAGHEIPGRVQGFSFTFGFTTEPGMYVAFIAILWVYDWDEHPVWVPGL